MAWFFKSLHFLVTEVQKESLKPLIGFFGKTAKMMWVVLVVNYFHDLQHALASGAGSDVRDFLDGF